MPYAGPLTFHLKNTHRCKHRGIVNRAYMDLTLATLNL